SKSAVVPIIVVLIIGVVAAILIYVVSNNAKTTTISGDELTAVNLSDYEEKIRQALNINSKDINLLYDSTVNVSGGKVQDMMLKLAINYSGDTEYWKVEESSEGIQVTYVEKVNSPTVYYTMYDLAQYLEGADGLVDYEEYTAAFGTATCSTVEYGETLSYIWNDGFFEEVYYTIYMQCYTITVTSGGGLQTIFYVPCE
ncbi:MAG: hypothetical protein LUD19_04650, partial [Clostridia bacterium]|nr:hypothetical protein [Clostridia bacterium]